MLIRIFLLNLLITQVSLSEIYDCEGTWTNKPCNKKIVKKFKEKIYKAPKENKIDLDKNKKQNLLSDLRKFAKKASKENNLDFPISEVVAFCNEKSTKLVNCSNRIQRKIDSITKAINPTENPTKDKAKPNNNEQDITIIDNRRNIIRDLDFNRKKRKNSKIRLENLLDKSNQDIITTEEITIKNNSE